jgi:hypothetical protein
MQKYIPKELINKYNNRRTKHANVPEEEEQDGEAEGSQITTSSTMSKYKSVGDTKKKQET